MHCEANRLETFREWPTNAAVSPERIAKAGFFYSGQAQTVQCFLCGVTVSEWNFGDQAMSLHRQSNPECPFVVDPSSTCNVPLINSDNVSAPSSNENETTSQNDTQPYSNERPSAEFLQSLKSFTQRLSTFVNWPKSDIISPESLAKAGFYYLKRYDMVECVYCEGVILRWEPGDDPDQEHKRHFPLCDFYIKVLAEDDLSAEKLGLSNVKLMPGITSNFTELGIQNHSAPRQPKHATFEGRLHTFQGWPSNLRQTPEMLADAGFYYVGSEDQVRCFHCDGGLRNWEETDDAWVEHAKWFPKCGYIALVRGQDFIKQCVDNRPPLDPAILASVSDDSAEVSTPPVSPANTPSTQSSGRQVTDSELEGLLGTPPAMAALEIGLHVGRVKMALKRRMEQTGLPYVNADQLIEDVTQVQLGEEDNILNRQTPDSPASELTHLLNQIISTAEAASSSMAQAENAPIVESKQNDVPQRSSPSIEMESDGKMETKKKDSKAEGSVSLEEENRRLKEARLCKICMDREVAVVFLPCGHLSTCVFCAPSLTHCPMCRHEIRATVRTFLA